MTESFDADTTRALQRREGASSAQEVVPVAGTMLGRYRVTGMLGKGGMGVVLAAEDPELGRRVAIKLLRHAHDGEGDGSERLSREARALARLSHPNVVNVFEVGHHEDRLFIVMELVDGVTLRKKLAERAPGAWGALLDVLLEAGRGLVAAHETSVVHRDFKPDNVIVGRDGRVRVLDFGIAQQGTGTASSSNAELPELPIDALSLTRTGMVVGTPAYMAPELVLGKPATPESDQFAFCVIAHTVLTGVRPFAGKTLAELAHAATVGEFSAPAPGYDVDPKLLAIVRRGLAADPSERWPDMEQLLGALQTQKKGFVVWPRAAALGAVVLSLGAPFVLVGGDDAETCAAGTTRMAALWNPESRSSIGTALGATQAGWKRDAWSRTEQTLDAYAAAWVALSTEVCQQQESSALHAESRAACVDDRFQKMAAVVQWLDQGGTEVANAAVQSARSLPELRGCMDADAAHARPPLPQEMHVAAAVSEVRSRLATAEVWIESGRIDEAIAVAREQRARGEALGYAPLHAESLWVEARAMGASERLLEQRALLEQTHAAAVAAGHDAVAMNAASGLVEVHAVAGSFDDGLQWSRQADALLQRLGDDPAHRALLTRRLGQLHSSNGEYAKAIEFVREAVAQAESLVADGGVSLGAAVAVLSHTLDAAARYDEALEAAHRSLEILRDEYGPEHPRVADAHAQVGLVLYHQGELDLAIERFRVPLEILAAAFGPDYPRSGWHYINLGNALMDMARYDEARVPYGRALELAEAQHGPDSPMVAGAYYNLGRLNDHAGDFDAALELYARSRSAAEASLGAEHPSTALIYNNIGNIEHALGRFDSAKAMHERTLAIRLKALGENHPHTAGSLDNLARTQLALRQLEEAEAAAQRSLAALEASVGPDHVQLGHTLTTLGEVFVAQGRVAESIAPLRRALSIRLAQDADLENVAATRRALSFALVQAGTDLEEARTLLEQVEAYCRDRPRCVDVASLRTAFDAAADGPGRSRN